MNKEVKKGDPLVPPKAEGSDQRPNSDDTDAARQKALAEKIMHDDREVLRKLAE